MSGRRSVVTGVWVMIALLLVACHPAPRHAPVKAGPVDTGPGTLEFVRRGGPRRALPPPAASRSGTVAGPSRLVSLRPPPECQVEAEPAPPALDKLQTGSRPRADPRVTLGTAAGELSASLVHEVTTMSDQGPRIRLTGCAERGRLTAWGHDLRA